ncbi:MAG: 2-C-methyl-D-erythritol 4-phosphate cytidylyltransferase [Desulfosoma sp.]|uniref:2-C-methyl-D-erythritol 4-phosphate cytidylyltransferase n=1 Tax=Desulfosoma sp. TaxID=2603217 RepID=UPI00404A643C
MTIATLSKPLEQTFAVVPAAGSGVRMGLAHPKQFHPLHGKPILAWTLEVLRALPFLHGIITVVPENALDSVAALISSLGAGPIMTVVAGGARRQDSVLSGLQAVPDSCRWVLIHDGVRPMASSELFFRTYEAAQRCGAAVCACRVVETVKMAEEGWVQATLPRDQVWLVQTPQVFRRDLLEKAFRQAQALGWDATDDASLVERLGVRVAVVEGEKSNIKITTPDDLLWASWYLEHSPVVSASLRRQKEGL